jgi:hypothetical protein
VAVDLLDLAPLEPGPRRPALRTGAGQAGQGRAHPDCAIAQSVRLPSSSRSALSCVGEAEEGLQCFAPDGFGLGEGPFGKRHADGQVLAPRIRKLTVDLDVKL